MKDSEKMYWEDFHPGSKEFMGRILVDRDEVIEFGRKYDPQPFHVDELAAKESLYGSIIASGWHTCSMVMRLMCDSYLINSASLGSPGMESVKWLLPAYPKDELSAYRTVLETRKSSSKPDRGIVKTLWEVYNQKDELIMSMVGVNFFLKREVAV